MDLKGHQQDVQWESLQWPNGATYVPPAQPDACGIYSKILVLPALFSSGEPLLSPAFCQLSAANKSLLAVA